METQRVPFKGVEENEAIRSILEGTSSEVGEAFFDSLVENLSKVLHTYGAWVTEYLEDTKRLRSIAFFLGGNRIESFEYPVTGTVCEVVVEERRLVHIRDRLFERFHGNPELGKALPNFRAVSYLGIPFEDTDGTILGHLSVIDQLPIPEDPQVFNVFRIFANRASAEMRRVRAEKEILQREEKLRRLFDSAMDAIIEFDSDFKVTSLNPAASKLFGYGSGRMQGRLFNLLLTKQSSAKLLRISEFLDAKPEGEKFIWIPEGIRAVSEAGAEFPAEATLSSYVMGSDRFYTLILRNVNERLEAEQKIRSLASMSEYLKEEIKSLTEENGIIGDSVPLKNVLEDVKKVAATDATVLILGETGTGKELIARSIHSSSRRSEKPFVKVNCPAIPSNLIESELFGHEKGAFTGATGKREGRFSIADGGTIFLDEIGELPLDLQSKLLRVLQEGEFEPVGSSRTVRVNVRVISATNRDLLKEVREGRFREDLYYRLNVFQIELPPLRERSEDIERLARAFADKFSARNGITLAPLSADDIARLRAYHWPGNIRELQNVIERAVITSAGGKADLERALPVPRDRPPSAGGDSAATISDDAVLSDSDLREFEKNNILRALKKAGWKVSGKAGAAAMLGIPSSTLNSKIKAFGIEIPSK
ncbi:MAG: sigma 54-interacting transcriptional regulator [Candidatus Dadabacteria bacterium]|nr:sigma 54-interacting transcriptional regulator [Candidatus Dadabacteria bacterium]